MNRRKALRSISVATGAGLIIPSFIGCNTSVYDPLFFTKDDLALVDEIGETILPATVDTPGAKEAMVSNFLDKYINDCFTVEQQDIVRAGLDDFKTTCKVKYEKGFRRLSVEQRLAFLTELDSQAKRSETLHYFSLLKSSIVLSFFTSQEGFEKALDYLPVPGKFIGNYPLKEGQKTWAL